MSDKDSGNSLGRVMRDVVTGKLPSRDEVLFGARGIAAEGVEPMSHTPGPWRLEGDRIMAANEKHVALIHDDGTETYVSLTEADMHLISAAPDLLATLKEIEYAGEAGGCPSCGGQPHMDHCSLQAAIRKAEGRA